MIFPVYIRSILRWKEISKILEELSIKRIGAMRYCVWDDVSIRVGTDAQYNRAHYGHRFRSESPDISGHNNWIVARDRCYTLY